MEEWKDIEGFEGLYQISNKGRIKSLGRPSKGYGDKFTVDRIIKDVRCTNGYRSAFLNKNGVRYVRLVHRLVAQAFIPNPSNCPQVNHKDEDITNNDVSNLEWCTSKYNANYGTRNKRCRDANKKYFKPVYQLDKDCGMVIRWWDSIKDASRALGINDSLIIRVCKGKGYTAGGFRWVYSNERDERR